MPPLKVLNQKENCAILKKHGFTIVRGGKGSHIKIRKIVDGRTIAIIVPENITPWVQRNIIKKSGIPRSEFEVPTKRKK